MTKDQITANQRSREELRQRCRARQSNPASGASLGFLHDEEKIQSFTEQVDAKVEHFKKDFPIGKDVWFFHQVVEDDGWYHGKWRIVFGKIAAYVPMQVWGCGVLDVVDGNGAVFRIKTESDLRLRPFTLGDAFIFLSRSYDGLEHNSLGTRLRRISKGVYKAIVEEDPSFEDVPLSGLSVERLLEIPRFGKQCLRRFCRFLAEEGLAGQVADGRLLALCAQQTR